MGYEEINVAKAHAHSPSIGEQMVQDINRLLEVNAKLVEALRNVTKAASSAAIAGQSLYAAPVVEAARALLRELGETP